MIKQMRYFQAVVRCQSFTKAAEECFISQSAISQQLQNLERELGVTLLQRDRRKITLTPAGEHFYKKSLNMVRNFDRLCSEVKHIANGAGNNLTIGYLQNYSGLELKQTIPEFSKKFPEVLIQFASGTHEDLYNYLRSGKVDVVVSDLRRNPSQQYVNFYLTKKCFYAEISANNPLTRFEELTMDDLQSIPCILVANEDQEISEEMFYREYMGVKSEFIFVESLNEAHLMVVSGRGYLPIDFNSIPKIRDEVKFIPIVHKDKRIYRQYFAFWRVENTNKYIEDFAALLKEKFTAG